MDFTPFIEHGGSREHLKAPFAIGDHVYATNGHILIKVSASKKPDAPVLDDDKFANIVTGKFQNFPRSELFEDLPELPQLDLETCSVCEGTGLAELGLCCECDGDGEAWAENEFNRYLVPCKSCDETGERIIRDTQEICPGCIGTGEREAGNKCKPADICGVHINAYYGHIISALPNVKVAPVLHDKNLLAFKFDGGCGVLMGRTPQQP